MIIILCTFVCNCLRRLNVNMKWVALLLFVFKGEHKKMICLVSCFLLHRSLFGAFLSASVLFEVPNFNFHPTLSYFLIVCVCLCVCVHGLTFFFSCRVSAIISSDFHILIICIIILFFHITAL